jgi:hypothetical protein
MATIKTRSGEGRPLTNDEVDDNFTNLNTDKLENITSESIEDLSDVNSMTPTDGQVLTWDNTNSYWTAADAAGGDVVDDTTPQLGGDLDVNGNDIVTTSNGDITLAPNGTGKVIIDNAGFSVTLEGNTDENPRFTRAQDLTSGVALGQYRARGTLSSLTTLQDTDVVGGFNGFGYDGTDYQGTAKIRYKVDGAVSTGVVPQKIVFITGETNSASSAERLIIKPDGKVEINSDTVFTKAETGASALTLESRRSRGTIASPTALSGGDAVTKITSKAYDGSSYLESASISFDIDSISVSTGNAPQSITFSTGDASAQAAMTIDAARQVGIGTTNPNALLDISGGGTAINVTVDGGIQVDANGGGADDIGVFVRDVTTSNASPTVRVQGQRDDANVSQVFGGGLLLNKLRGDAKVAQSQHVGTVYFGGNHTDGTEANVAFGASISGLATGAYNSASDMPTSLVFYTGSTGITYPTGNTTFGTEAMRIQHDQRILMGTNAITVSHATLTTKGMTAYGAGLAIENDGSANSWARLEFSNDQASGTGIIFRDQLGTFALRNDNSSGTAQTTQIVAGNTTAGHIVFLKDAQAGGEIARFTSAGRLGIGESNPATELEVNGTVTATSYEGSGSNLTGVLTNVKSFKTFLTADATVNGSATYTTKNVFNTTPDINVGGFTVAASGVTVPEAGVYVVMANMMYNSTAVRANTGFRFLINSTGQAEQALSSYIRSASGHNEASSSLSTMYNLSANDVIGLQFAQEGAAGTVNLETGSHIAIYRVA